MSTEFNEESFDLGVCLMEELASIGCLEESKVNRFKAREKMLAEAAAHPQWGRYNEERAENSPNTPETYHYRGKPIEWRRFKNVYTDYENFPTSNDVMTALGFPPELFNDHKSMTRALNRIRKYFAKHNREAHQMGIGSVSTDKRQEAYYLSPGQEKGELPKASTDNIDPGYRNRKTPSSRVLDMLNDQSVMPGQFYNDISRIQRRRWGNWVRFWERQMSRIKNQKSLIGRVWQKTFIMGYQFDKKMFIEIWYNSASSSFSIYDQNGVEVGKPTETLQETIRYFVHHLVQYSEQDREVFQRSGAASQVAQSSLRALTQAIGKDASIASREAELAAIEARGGAQHTIRQAVAAGKGRIDSWKDSNEGKHKEAKAKRDGQNFTTDPWEMGTRGANHRDKQKQDELRRKREEMEAAEKKAKEEFAKRASERFGEKLKDDEVNRTFTGEYTVKDKKSTEQTRDQSTALLTRSIGKAEYDPFSKEFPDLPRDQVERYMREYETLKREYEKRKEALEVLKQEEKEIKRSRKALGDRFPILERRNKVAQTQAADRVKGSEEEMERLMREMKKQEKVSKKEKGTPRLPGPSAVNEGVNDDLYRVDKESAVAISMASREMDQQAAARRHMAQRSPFTTASIRAAVMDDMVRTYDQTRAGDQVRRPRSFLDKWFRGRKAPIVLPNEEAGVWDSIRMALVGARYRADFVIGYSLRDEINIEIWYVTEPGQNVNSVVSSFYVYDVTSATLVRSNLPYYRNAVQVVMAKIGVI